MQEYREKTSDKQRGKASPDKNKHWESLQITKKGPAWRAKQQAPTFPLADYIWNKKAVLDIILYTLKQSEDWATSLYM